MNGFKPDNQYNSSLAMHQKNGTVHLVLTGLDTDSRIEKLQGYKLEVTETG